MTESQSVIIDTDCALGRPGAKVDDGFAVALALASPEIDVQLVTTTAGNVDVVTATTRTKALLERLGRRDVPVVAGGCPDGSAAARAIAERALADPGTVTLVALGPLTTVAAAIAAAPGVAASLREVVVMGGRFGAPGQGPAEFNTRSDPWATRAVLDSGARVRFVGIDVTTRVALSRDDLARIAAGSPGARYLAGQARARVATLTASGPWAAGGSVICPMHDPVAVLAVTHPELLAFEPMCVDVDLGPGDSHGVTSARRQGGAPVEPTSWVATDVDEGTAKDLLVERLSRV